MNDGRKLCHGKTFCAMRRLTSQALVSASLALSCGRAPLEAPEAPLSGPPVRVMTDRGPVVGASVDGLDVFLGIPFAAPPQGERRFAPPVPPPAWNEPRPATSFGPACPQLSARDGRQVIGDEDCLYLNVWAPSKASGRPVMAFIHGGAGIIGRTSDRVIDGAVLARRTGHVVVTIAYRLGALGFLALPELVDGGFAAAGNQSLMDQQLALKWVQANIAAFGGDPARVMLFGESAGSIFTCVHAVAPGSDGLFHAAILQSGSCGALPTQAEAFSAWAGWADELGCPAEGRIECLRALPAERLVRAGSRIITPIVDGAALPVPPEQAWLDLERPKRPLAVGTNEDEASFFSGLMQMLVGGEAFINTRWGYTTALQVLFGNDAARLEALYPYDAHGGGVAALNVALTDVRWACPMREMARAWTRGGGTVFQYEFTASLRGPLGERYGATHGLELLFLFGNRVLDYELDERELALADWMQSRWGRFAATASMRAEEDDWPAFSEQRPVHYEIGFDRGVRDVLRDGRCDALIASGIVRRIE